MKRLAELWILALAVTLVAAAAAAARATAAQGYWAAGLWRLVAIEAMARFYPWAAAVSGPFLVAAVLLRLRGRRRAGRVHPAFVVGAAVVGAVVIADQGLTWWPTSRPNVLLISIDTLRADHLGAYGSALPTSPTVDRALAAAGVTFEEVTSQSPKTTPSHMTMLTSLYPSVHGVEMWEDGKPGPVLAPQVVTLAEVLKNAGYATAAFTGGANVDRSRGFDQGFDVYKESAQLPRATRWIGHHAWRPFFVFFHTFAVHDPYLPPSEMIARFAPEYRGPILDAVNRLRGNHARDWWDAHKIFWASVDGTKPDDVRFVERLYDAGISTMDETLLAPLLAVVDGLRRPTLVVFTADHGEAFHEHGVFLHDDLYRETVHVPLVLRLPGRLPAGRRVRGSAGVIDVMPTILDLVGVPGPAAMQGQSLAGRIDGPPPDDATTISEYSQPNRPYLRVQRGPLAFVSDGGREALFDDGADPAEQHDLAAARPEAVAAAREIAARWHDASLRVARRFAPVGSATPDPETVRQLKALGYVD